jgi:hypothetical protein
VEAAPGAAASDEAAPGSAVILRNGEGVGYTVPQLLRREETQGDVEIFFRVRRNFRSAAIRVRAGDQEIAAFRRPYMAPGEMEHIRLPRKTIAAVEQEICVSVEEERP